MRECSRRVRGFTTYDSRVHILWSNVNDSSVIVRRCHYLLRSQPSVVRALRHIAPDARMDVIRREPIFTFDLVLAAPGCAHAQQQLTFDLQFCYRPSEVSQRTEQKLPQAGHYLPILNERGIHSLQTNIQAGQQNAWKW